VHFHSYLWEIEPPQRNLLAQNPNTNKQICKRDTILDAAQTDWMEWQAGYVCGALLMPVSRVRKLVGSYLEAQGLFGALGHAGAHGQALIDQMQAAFQVSAEAARVRLFKLGFLGEVDAGPSLFSV
jgi:Zn-dependent peptidase ImmA (M78 family)